jgi:acyl-coenzyme A thioesterase PaaI-like protein
VTAHFTCDPDPDNPGWLRWRLNDPTRFNEAVLGPLLVRRESDSSARVRLIPQHHHTNLSDNVHGAVTLGLIDVALFAAWRQISNGDAGGAVTLGLDTQFIGAGDPGRPLDAVVELLRETRRLAFLRGLVVQDDDVVASFSGTIRKPSRV